jgi:hypothetical protein
MMITPGLGFVGIWGNKQYDDLDHFCRIEKVNRDEVLRCAPSMTYSRRINLLADRDTPRHNFLHHLA